MNILINNYFIRKIYVNYLYFRIKKSRSDGMPAILHAISCGVGVSKKRAAKIFKNSCKSLAEFGLEFARLSSQPIESLGQEIADIEIVGENYIKESVASGRPIILVSIHMGSFYKGYLRLAQYHATDRKINIVKLAGKTKSETGVYEKIKKYCPSINVLRFDQDIARSCFFELRRGGIVGIMNDIEVKVNKRVEVNFLGKKSYLQCGIGQLAVPTESLVIPLVNYVNDAGIDVLEIYEPIDAALRDGEAAMDGVSRVTSVLAGHTESWLRRYPDQFQYWNDIVCTLYAKYDDKVNLDVKYN